MDLTPLFCQVVTDIKGSGRFHSTEAEEDAENKSISSQSHFNTKLSELVASVTYMRDYLISNKKDYINIYNSLLSMASTMTDEERDQIDRDVQDFMKLSNDVVKILKVEAKSRQSKQRYEHECYAIAMVEEYIKTINDFHNKQKALRLRRNLDSQNFFRLSKSIKGVESPKQEKESPKYSGIKEKRSNFPAANGSLRKRKVENSQMNHFLEEEEAQNATNLGFSADELKMFKDEGTRIYNEMNSMNDEVKQIGQKLTEIAKLQEAFSENVLKQEMDLSHLNTTTIASTESIREGNEQLREAMRKNAGFRVFVLFFITTLAFVVLFLDWYNG